MAMSFSEEVRAILGSDAPTVTDVPALLEAKNGTQEQRIADAKAYYEQPFRKQEEIRQATLDEILKKEMEAKAAADEAARLKAQAGMLTGSSSSGMNDGGRNYYAELEAQYGPDYARAVQVMNNSRLNDALTTIVGKTFGLGMLVPTQEPAPVRNAVAGVPGVVTIAPVRDAIGGGGGGSPVPAPDPVVVTPVAPQPTVVGTPLPPLSSGSSSSGGGWSDGGTGVGVGGGPVGAGGGNAAGGFSYGGW